MSFVSRIGAAIAVSALAACTSITPVTSFGDGKFMLGYQRRGGLDSWTEVKAQAIAEANKHCASTGQAATILDADEQGARGWTPMNVEVTFRCVSP